MSIQVNARLNKATLIKQFLMERKPSLQHQDFSDGVYSSFRHSCNIRPTRAVP